MNTIIFYYEIDFMVQSAKAMSDNKDTRHHTVLENNYINRGKPSTIHIFSTGKLILQNND